MSISSTGLYGSATIVNSDLFNDVEALKEQVTTLSTSYLTTSQEHLDDSRSDFCLVWVLSAKFPESRYSLICEPPECSSVTCISYDIHNTI